MISQREQRVGLAKTWTHDVWHLTYQVTQKLLAHTLGIWLNLHQGREPLELYQFLIGFGVQWCAMCNLQRLFNTEI
jgi:hypothetical protein